MCLLPVDKTTLVFIMYETRELNEPIKQLGENKPQEPSVETLPLAKPKSQQLAKNIPSAKSLSSIEISLNHSTSFL